MNNHPFFYAILACCIAFCVPLPLFAQNATKPTLAYSLKMEEDALVFFVIGDWGRNGEYNQTEVANAMAKCAYKFEPEFIISTGDNFYTNGVASVHDPLWMTSFENIYKQSSLHLDWYVVLGNHDNHGNPQAEVDYTNISRRWRMPARYFTNVFRMDDGKTARFIYLDTNPLVKKYHKEAEDYGDLARQDTARQMHWLDSVLAVSKEDWKIVIGHHPVYSSNKKHGDTKELQMVLEPRLEKNHVQMYLCGHDHDLQHQRPVYSGVDYFVSGAGSEVRPASSYAHTKFAKAAAGFAIVSIKGNQLKMWFVDKYLQVLYSFERGI